MSITNLVKIQNKYLKINQNNYQEKVFFTWQNGGSPSPNNQFIPYGNVYQINKDIPWGDSWGQDQRTDHHIKIQVGNQSWYVWQSGEYIRVGEDLNTPQQKIIDGDNHQGGDKILIVQEDGSLRLKNCTSDITHLKVIQNRYQEAVYFTYQDGGGINPNNQSINCGHDENINQNIPWGDNPPFNHNQLTDHHIKIRIGDKSWYVWQSGNYIRVGENLNTPQRPSIGGDSHQGGDKVLIVQENGSLHLENWDKWQQNREHMLIKEFEIVAITNESDKEQTIGNQTFEPWQAQVIETITYPRPNSINCYGNVREKCLKGLIFTKDGNWRLYNWDEVKIVQRTRIEEIGKLQSGEIVCYETKKEGFSPLERSITKFEKAQDISGKNITIYPNQTYQKITGFGGAFTDAAAKNIKEMSRTSQNEILEAYFGSDGIGYSVGRVPMGSTDFSTESYSYVNATVEDKSLSNFNLSHWDVNYKIPLIQAANSKRQAANAKPLTLFSSVWTAPPWMKEDYRSDNHWIGGKLKTDCYKPWANYFVKFFESYAEYDTYANNNNQEVADTARSKVSDPLAFWGCTVQNEPSGAFDNQNLLDWGAEKFRKISQVSLKVTWESMEFPPDAQANFIGNYLGLKLDNNRHLGKDGERIKIMCYEDQKNGLGLSKMPDGPQNTLNSLHNQRKDQFVDGIAFHWYQKNIRALWNPPITGDPWCANSLSDTDKWLHENGFSDKFLLATEACQGCFPQDPIGPAHDLDTKWERAEDYGKDIITDLNNGTVGWMDWNLALDMEGGPNWAGNNCDALVLCDSYNDAFYMQPMFYYFAHFTKFMTPDSVSIRAELNVSGDVRCTACKTPDNQIVVVVQNASDQSPSYWINIENHGYLHVDNMAPHSIRTFVIPTQEA